MRVALGTGLEEEKEEGSPRTSASPPVQWRTLVAHRLGVERGSIDPRIVRQVLPLGSLPDSTWRTMLYEHRLHVSTVFSEEKYTTNPGKFLVKQNPANSVYSPARKHSNSSTANIARTWK